MKPYMRYEYIIAVDMPMDFHEGALDAAGIDGFFGPRADAVDAARLLSRIAETMEADEGKTVLCDSEPHAFTIGIKRGPTHLAGQLSCAVTIMRNPSDYKPS